MIYIKSLLQKLVNLLDSLKKWQVLLIITTLGLAVFSSGLNGAFQGDDNFQIVDNKPVHSLANLGQFFSSSTFFNGENLVGSFYRPMMTSTFALIYSLAGAQPIAYHVTQLLLYILCTFMLYLFLKLHIRSAVALCTSIVFLVHPINSQAVFAIPSMQEPLFFLFGISALYIVATRQSLQAYVWAAILLILSLLSKETGIVFVILSIAYLFLFDRAKTLLFSKVLVAPILIYLLLRINAVGIFDQTINTAPIGDLSLGERIVMIPSLVAFYISTFIIPTELATGYYWIHTGFSVQRVLLPMILLAAFVGLFIYLGLRVRKHLNHRLTKLYLFFALWAVVGLGPYLQIIPLDLTAAETWVFAAIVGVLGMISISFLTIKKHTTKLILVVLLLAIVTVFGIRTFIRGFDYATPESLAKSDIAVSKDNYFAINNLAQITIRNGDYERAAELAQRSIDIYPTVTNYTNLGVAQQKLGMYDKAKNSYVKGLTYGSLRSTHENLATVLMVVESPKNAITRIKQSLEEYPSSFKLWTFLAIQQAVSGDRESAKQSVIKASQYGSVPQSLYLSIFNGQQLEIPLPDINTVIIIPGSV